MLPDLRIETALDRLNVPTSKDLQGLQGQVEQLMQRVDLLLQQTQAHAASEVDEMAAETADEDRPQPSG